MGEKTDPINSQGVEVYEYTEQEFRNKVYQCLTELGVIQPEEFLNNDPIEELEVCRNTNQEMEFRINGVFGESLNEGAPEFVYTLNPNWSKYH